MKLEIDTRQLDKVIRDLKENVERADYATIMKASWPVLKPKIESFLEANYESFKTLLTATLTSNPSYMARKQDLIGAPIEVGMGVKKTVISADPLEMTKYLKESVTRIGSLPTNYADVVGGVGQASLDMGLKTILFKGGYPQIIQDLIAEHGGEGLLSLNEEQLGVVTEIISEFLYNRIVGEN